MLTKFRPKLVFLLLTLSYLLANNISYSQQFDNSAEKETMSLLPKGSKEIGEIKEEKKDEGKTCFFVFHIRVVRHVVWFCVGVHFGRFLAFCVWRDLKI
ncbi:unnamed protein product [Meloidogyne enterolobii]|uniref:Uncharacterized protein n=1 Tax=Meloidogyne enterolobii TaxID=390850 RepID=A0ACB0Y245_MELEN